MGGRQIIKLWEELGFKLSVADDVRGGWLLLLGGVASKITAHTPARSIHSPNSDASLVTTNKGPSLQFASLT
jgi:hypothetical protein